MDPRQHLDVYITAAMAHGVATRGGDDKATNKHHDELMDALRSLRASTVSWPEVLQDALGHEDPHVRCWAATHLLGVRPEPATAALEEVAGRRGVAAFNAKMVLKEWRAGRLRVT